MNALGSLWKTPERRITVCLLLFLTCLYVPFAGNYGMWDPWETHYSEVARQMLMRHDYVSLWWPGSPQDRNEFWSKPVLTFWLMALGMLATGLEHVGHAFDGEMAVGWTAEWAVRIPFILCGIACVWAVWELVRRLAGRRAGLWSAIVLATSAQFFFVTRQAMTDMAFVAPIAVALCFAGLALMLPAEEVEAELPRRERKVGRFTLSWPHAPIFYVTLGLVLLVTLPQLFVISTEVTMSVPLGKKVLKLSGLVPMLPWVGALVAYVLAGARARCRRQIYLHLAFVMCGLSTLAKGPAGIALPVLVVLAYLAVQGEIKRLVPDSVRGGAPAADGSPTVKLGLGQKVWHVLAKNPLELGLGVIVFIAVAFPWYHAMLIRHGMGFWNEFIGDNYVHRAAGRHGDRGTFEYYLTQIAHGMFPWTGVVAAATLTSLRKLAAGDGRAKLRGFAMVWFVLMFTVMSLVNTKFHHYILPGLPGLAILAGLYLEDLFVAPSRSDVAALVVVGLPTLALTARDLAMFPARLTWLFDYDYVNAPGGGRPWPPGAEYDYSVRLAWFGAFVVAATAALALTAFLRARSGQSLSPVDDGDVAAPFPRAAMAAFVGLPVATVVAAELWQPPFDAGPHPLANGWILVGAASSLFLLLLVGNGLRAQATRVPTLGLLAVGVMACFWTGWGLDRHLTDLSPHWSQKHVIASYYKLRKDESEPLVAWQMYWRGETFYSKNSIYDHRMKQEDKTVFLGDHNADKMQTWFRTHAGRRVFFIVERSRFETLRSLLPEASRSSLKAVDETNNKVYLAVANI